MIECEEFSFDALSKSNENDINERDVDATGYEVAFIKLTECSDDGRYVDVVESEYLLLMH